MPRQPCGKPCKPENVPTIMRALPDVWRCVRAPGHRGECVPTTAQVTPAPPLRPIRVRRP